MVVVANYKNRRPERQSRRPGVCCHLHCLPSLLIFCIIKIVIIFTLHFCIDICKVETQSYFWLRNKTWRLLPPTLPCFDPHIFHDHLWSSIYDYENLQHTTQPSLRIEQDLIEAKLSFFVFHCGLIELCASGGSDGGASDWDVSYKELGPTVHRAARAASNKI